MRFCNDLSSRKQWIDRYSEAECLVCHNSARRKSGRGLLMDGFCGARSLFVAATILVAAHVTLLVLDPRAIFQSNLFILMYPLLGVTVCLLGANTQSPETRPSWLLFGCGLLIAAVGQLGLTYYDFGTQIHTQTQAINSDFFFFAYGIPIMLDICSRSTDAGLKIFAWLDGAQSAPRSHARVLAALLGTALSG